MPDPIDPPRLMTGIRGLDRVLGGGLPKHGLYLLEGAPGSGKTTFSLQFLQTGMENGEGVLLVALSETADEIRLFAASHGWDLEGLEILDLSTLGTLFGEDGQQTVFHPSEIEFAEIMVRIQQRIDEARPARVVIDSLSELRHLAGEESIYRLQMDALKTNFLDGQRTVLLLDNQIPSPDGFALHTLVNGVLALDYSAPEFGPYRRRLRVQKMRGVKFKEGMHDFEILTGGICVYPRLVLSTQRQQRRVERVTSGINELDVLLGGGIDRGTSTVIMGAAGTGKSTLALQYSVAAAQRGEKAAMYIFDESLNTILERATGLSINAREQIEADRLLIQQVDPLELTPGKFTHIVQGAVADGATTIVIDSLTGYIASMGHEHHLALQIRNLLTYLGDQNVTTIIVSVQHGLIMEVEESPAGQVSFLADTVLLLRYYEHIGEVRRALSVFKRRTGHHEQTIRDISFYESGISIGPPLRDFRGILTGVPAFDPRPKGA